MKKISVIILALLLILTFSMASGAAGFLLGRDLSYNIVNSSSGDHDFSPTNINTLRPRSIDIIGVVKKYVIFPAASLVERAKEALAKVNDVSFKKIGVVESYDNQEGIVVTNLKDKILVSITKRFSTPGHSMDVTRISKTKEGYRIKFDIRDPEQEVGLIQVITYKTLKLEIPKEELDNTPYIFILEGYNKIPDSINM